MVDSIKFRNNLAVKRAYLCKFRINIDVVTSPRYNWKNKTSKHVSMDSTGEENFDISVWYIE